MEAGHHEAAWRLPESNPRADFDLAHWIGLAQLAEDAKFDSLFLADGPALTGTGEFRPPGQLEPLTLLTALSQHTSRIGLIATVSSTYNEPYNLARRLASVDHVSGGRAGWNIVTSAGAGRGRELRPRRPSRPRVAVRARRRVPHRRQGVVGQLGDARPFSPTRHRAATPTRRGCTPSTTTGDHFKVAGPLNVRAPAAGPPAAGAGGIVRGRQELRRPPRGGHLHRPPDLRARRGLLRRHQGADARRRVATPTACSCCRASCRSSARPSRRPRRWHGSSTSSGSRSTGCRSWPELRDRPVGVRARRAAARLRPGAPETRRRRRAVRTSSSSWRVREKLTVREILSRLGGGRGHFTFVGTPDQVADTIVAWFEGGAADGFNIMAPALPSGAGDLHRARAADPAAQGTVPRGVHGHARCASTTACRCPPTSSSRDAREWRAAAAPVDHGPAQGLPRRLHRGAEPRPGTRRRRVLRPARTQRRGQDDADRVGVQHRPADCGRADGLRSRLPDQGGPPTDRPGRAGDQRRPLPVGPATARLPRRLSRHRTQDRGAPCRRTAGAVRPRRTRPTAGPTNCPAACSADSCSPAP